MKRVIATTKESVGEMRVAIVAYGHCDNVLCLAKHLADHIEVTVYFIVAGDHFTRSIFDWDIKDLPYGVTDDQNVIQELLGRNIAGYIGQGVNISVIHTPSLRILRDWQRRNYKYIRAAVHCLMDSNYDVIHFNGSSGFQLYFQHNMRCQPKVYTIHDYLPHTGDVSCKSRALNIILNKYYAVSDYEFIQHYEILSERFSRFYNISRERVHTVYCGPLDIYNAFTNREVEEEPTTILFFGRIAAYKGLIYLLQAIPIIKREVPTLKVIIAGAGKLPSDVPLDGSVEIHNHHISNDELVDFIQKAALIVTPYTDATHSAVIMTAYAFAKPLVSSRVGGIQEVIQHDCTGKLVTPKDVKALAAAIVELMENPEKRKVMKHNIRNLSRFAKFAWPNVTQATIKVYEKAIGN